MMIGQNTFNLLFSSPESSNVDKMNFPYEWAIDIQTDIKIYYEWLITHIGQPPRWDVDDHCIIIDDHITRIKFFFKYEEDLVAFKLRWLGSRD